jgi:hypothetical protein
MGEARYPNGPTCEFQFNYESATVHLDAGRVISLDEEGRRENREKKDRALEQQVDDQARRDELRKKRKPEAEPAAAKPAEAPVQASLLDLPEKPEEK